MWFAVLYAVALAGVGAPPNVVFLSVDTLRADHLGCYGYAYDTSPALDQMAKESLLFEDCVCEVPLTNPSFSSMLSSLYPRMIGETRNGLRMPDSVPLITERFKAAGYQTMCVQSNWPLKGHLSHLDRGFDVYQDNFHKRRWGLMSSERVAEDVTNIALELLEARDAAKPFFFWVHYSDPHAPYKFHKDFNPHGKRAWRFKNPEMVRVKYDSEIAYTDAHIARLLEALPRNNTVILFAADHGESLFEHNYLGHGRRIYQDNLHIPLVIRAPGLAPGRTRVPARGVDVGTTLLALAGLTPAPGMLGKNLLEAGVPDARIRVIETYGGAAPKLPGVKAFLAGSGPMRQGVLCKGWKLILGGDAPELFYLPDDPGEENDLAGKNPDRVKELTQYVEAWNKQHPRGRSRHATLSDDDIQALKSLGYLE